MPDCPPAVGNPELLAKVAFESLGLIGRSPAFLSEIAKLPTLARCDVTVLVTGPTGTGKELAARAMHYLSPRHKQPFVPVDCGAIPAELVETELFGHEAGAYTGAVSRGVGLIAAAREGTLFLDEVDALSMAAQAKLLRFLQEREYRPVGSTEIKKADVRILAATNHDLLKRVHDGVLREDLFYRLAVIQLRLPSLRERPEDVALLAVHFLTKYAGRFGRPVRGFSAAALQRLMLHQWPGNIRELENVVQAAVALCDGHVVEPQHIPVLSANPDKPASFRDAKADAIGRFEREYLLRLLRACNGNVSQAARVANKHRRAFWELVRKHGIQSAEYCQSAAESRSPEPARHLARHQSA